MEEHNKNKLPKIFYVLRVLGFIGMAVAVTLFIIAMTIKVPSMYDSNWFDQSVRKSELSFGGGAAFILSAFLILASFEPAIRKLLVRTSKYVINETESELRYITKKGAEIASDGITTIAKSIKNGLKEDTIFCKYCGKVIDADSSFCMHCGKQQ